MNYLEYKNKLVSIENPMSQVIKNFLSKNKKAFNANKKLTYWITQISQKIYDKAFKQLHQLLDKNQKKNF